MNTQHTTPATSAIHDVKSVVAVDEHVPSAGAIVWWRLSGRVDYEALKTAWLAEGLDEKEMPTACSPATALRRAANTLREARRLVRPLGRGNGFAIVKERVVGPASGDAEPAPELEYDVLCKVTLDAVGRVKVEGVSAYDDTSEFIERMRREVSVAYDAALGQLETEDFSNWLVRLMPRLDALGLRDTGGVYFIPPSHSGKLASVARVLGAVTNHSINRVPAMRSDEAVSAILDALTAEATAEAEAMEKELDDAKLGAKGYQNRITACDAVESKVARYEALLGCKLDEIRERLETLRANLSVAVLKADAAAEAQ